MSGPRVWGRVLIHLIFDLLLDKVRKDRFPSATRMDMLEQMMKDDDVESYTEVLMDKIRADAYPSYEQLQRLLRFA